MQRVIGLFVGACLAASVVLAQDAKPTESNEAVEILKKVDAAAKKVKSAAYKIVYKGVGDAAAQMASTEGTAVISGWANGAPKKFRVDVKIKRSGSSEETRVVAGGDGDNYWVIDYANKIAYEDIDPAVLGRLGGSARNAALVQEFVHGSPFSDEINGDKQELLGSAVIGGEDCYKIRVVYASGTQQAIWHFSKKDFLPRQRLDGRVGTEGGRQRTITNLVIDSKLDDEMFRLKLPEGFTKSDDFAP